jgi:hypothetical protein
MLLPNMTGSLVILHLVITLVDASRTRIYARTPAQLSLTLKLCSLVLCFDLWIASLWILNLVTIFACYPSLYCACSYSPIMCHSKFHFGGRLSNGVLINNWRCRDKTESLLWVHTQGCAARHALVSRLLIVIHYETPPMCYFHVNSSWVISLYLIWRSLYRANVVELPPKVVKRLAFEEQVTDININRLQEVVDKWLFSSVLVRRRSSIEKCMTSLLDQKGTQHLMLNKSSVG